VSNEKPNRQVTIAVIGHIGKFLRFVQAIVDDARV
jgi:hypothetical protein